MKLRIEDLEMKLNIQKSLHFSILNFISHWALDISDQ